MPSYPGLLFASRSASPGGEALPRRAPVVGVPLEAEEEGATLEEAPEDFSLCADLPDFCAFWSRLR